MYTVTALLIITLGIGALALIIVSFVYYIKMLRLASKYAKGYFKSYREIKTNTEAGERFKRDLLTLVKTPEEFKNKDLLRAVRLQRTTYWFGILAVIILLFIPT